MCGRGEVEWAVVVHMSGGKVEQDGIAVFGYGFVNSVVNGATHERVAVAVGELSDDKSFDAGKDAGHAEIAHHAVDVVMPLADVFNEKNTAFGMGVEYGIKAVRCALQSVEDAEVSADKCAFGFTEAVERMWRQVIVQGLAG